MVALLSIAVLGGGSPLPAVEIDHGKYAGEAREVKSLVEKAASAFQEKGKDYTLKLLNASAGPFKKKHFYVISLDFAGNVLATSANRKLVGKNVLNLKDSEGKLFCKEMIQVAKDPGSGWVEYRWKRHGEKDPTMKRTFVMRVPGDDTLVASGYYVK